MQYAVALGDSELVIGLCEVIHADKLITRLGQRLDGLLKDVELLLRRRRSASLILRWAANSVGRCA